MTEPPNGLPRQLWRGNVDSQLMDAFFAIVGYGKGWGIGWTWIDNKPRRKWSKAAKARNRRKRLKKRLEKKYPLFSDEFFAIEIAKRRDYFDGIDPIYVPPQQRKEK